MEITLTEQNKKEPESRHQIERDGRVRDRMKAVLLKSEGWTDVMIGQALRIYVDTVGQQSNSVNQNNRLSLSSYNHRPH